MSRLFLACFAALTLVAFPIESYGQLLSRRTPRANGPLVFQRASVRCSPTCVVSGVEVSCWSTVPISGSSVVPAEKASSVVASSVAANSVANGGTTAVAVAAPVDKKATFKVYHEVRVTDVPAETDKLQLWFWLPQETAAQRVIDLKVAKEIPGYVVVADDHGNRYLAVEIDKPTESEYLLATEFTIERREQRFSLSEQARLDSSQMGVFGDYLDVAGFHATQSVLEECDRAIPQPAGMVSAARGVFDWVVDNTIHYGSPLAKGENAKLSSVADNSSGSSVYDPATGTTREVVANDYVNMPLAGNAETCFAQRGGGCTDQNSLLISWLRHLGVPAQIEFSARLPGQEGQMATSGYRCYVNYFIPNFGWIPMDVSQAGNSSANMAPGSAESNEVRDFYFSGVDHRRVSFYRGRNLPLTTVDGEKTEPLNLFIHAYCLVNGKPHSSFQVKWKYEELSK